MSTWIYKVRRTKSLKERRVWRAQRRGENREDRKEQERDRSERREGGKEARNPENCGFKQIFRKA
eukprot:1337857-Amorphochlora_amoeboformis.AAC.2